MRVRPSERGLQNPVNHIKGQIGANLESAPDRRLRVPKISSDPKQLNLRRRGSAQLRATWPGALLAGLAAETGQIARERAKVVELGPRDDRLELAQQLSPAVVFAHAGTVPPLFATRIRALR